MWAVVAVLVFVVWWAAKSGGGTAGLSATSTSGNGSNFVDNFLQAQYDWEDPSKTGLATRLNNPGALKAPGGSPNFWPGQTGVDANGFAIFGDIGDGWAAAQSNFNAQLAKNPGQDFYDYTSTYTPDNSDEYAQHIADYLGVDPSTPIQVAMQQTGG